MEGYENILNLLSNNVFSIVAYFFVFWYLREQTNANREAMQKLNEQHKEEMNSVKEALNNNTLTMQKLVDRLDDKGL